MIPSEPFIAAMVRPAPELPGGQTAAASFDSGVSSAVKDSTMALERLEDFPSRPERDVVEFAPVRERVPHPPEGSRPSFPALFRRRVHDTRR